MKKLMTSLLTLFCSTLFLADLLPAQDGIPHPEINPKSELKADAPCDPTYVFLKNVPQLAQETGSWCWAAAQQMVMWYSGSAYYNEQCSIATAVLRSTNSLPDSIRSCCDPQSIYTPDCATTAWPDFTLYGFYVTQVDVSDVTDPLGSTTVDGWHALKAQICSDRPFVITLQSNYSHEYVVRGYKESTFNDEFVPQLKYQLNTVYLIDPAGTGAYDSTGHELPDLKVWNYSSYRFGEDGSAVHTRDFIDIFP
jgi:hypothetical protein